MSQFHNLTVNKITQQTDDTVSVSFIVPGNLAETFKYISGQYLTLKFDVNGTEERRAYSLCSSPSTDNFPEVAVKKVENGIVSNHINNNLKEGDVVAVMPPQGNFILETNDKSENHYVAFAAGSGITPIFSMIKSVTQEEPKSKFTLIYGNKTKASTIFGSELREIKNLTIINTYTQEKTGNSIAEGRINSDKIAEIIKENTSILKADKYFLCGPEEMIVAASGSLKEYGIEEEKINYELFTTPVLLADESPKEISDFSGEAKVTVIYDDEEVEFSLKANGATILDAAMENDVDVPFSCKGAVCCTCKALVTEGKATMDANYSLSESEVEEGYILTCQAHPASPTLKVDFDEA